MQTENIEYHCTTPIQLRWNDMDALGHVNNSVFFQYYDTAKVDYMSHIFPDMKQYGIVVAHIEADFLAQVHPSDHIEVHTAITHIGTKSFTLMQEVVDVDTHEVKCIGKTIMVAYDQEKNESVAIHPEWIEKIEAFEGRRLRKV